MGIQLNGLCFFPSSSPRLSVDFFFSSLLLPKYNKRWWWLIHSHLWCCPPSPSFFGGGGWYIPICGALLPLRILLTKSTAIGTPIEESRLPRNPPDWILVVYGPSTCLRGNSVHLVSALESRDDYKPSIEQFCLVGSWNQLTALFYLIVFWTNCEAPSETALATTLKPSVFANMGARVRFKLKILIIKYGIRSHQKMKL